MYQSQNIHFPPQKYSEKAKINLKGRGSDVGLGRDCDRIFHVLHYFCKLTDQKLI